MSRPPEQRLDAVDRAVAAIRAHLRRGPIDDPLVFDAVRARLIESGEAVKDLPSPLLAHAPEIPWRQVAQMRDHLAHRYFDTSRQVVAATVADDLPALLRAVERLRAHL